jgi:hypothetical protein
MASFFPSSRHRERGDFQENILCDSRSALLAIMLPTQTRPWEMRLLQNCVSRKDGENMGIVTHARKEHRKLHVKINNCLGLNFCQHIEIGKSLNKYGRECRLKNCFS